MARKQFAKTNVAGARVSLGADTRTATLNVRATPVQYEQWRRAADLAGRSLSAWVANWLDELAGVPGRLLRRVERMSSSWVDGKVPIREVELEMVDRFAWPAVEVSIGLGRCGQLGLVELIAGPQTPNMERFAPSYALRDAEGTLITHVALPAGARARRKRMI